IHMNGRIYDPKLARFLQADPFVQSPTNTQSLNRYSYGFNNPLNGTDPSGYSFFKKIVGIVVAAVGAVICGPTCGQLGYALIGAAAGGVSAAVNGGDILQGIVLGGISGAAFSGVGASKTFGYSLGDGLTKLSLNALANGVVGGITNVLAGGKFGHGFLAAGLSAYAKPGIRSSIGTEASGLPLRISARAIIGGTISKITGGKFSNGATTAAFSQLFNEEQTLNKFNKESHEKLEAVAIEENQRKLEGALRCGAVKPTGNKSHASGDLVDEGFIFDSETSVHEVACDYECVFKDGSTKIVRLKHYEKYSYPQSQDVGTEGQCIGCLFKSEFRHDLHKAIYTREKFIPFDPRKGIINPRDQDEVR
ncbi:hypothetical protein LCGC14_2398800, partial [marine sediment metagenome]